MPEKTVAQKGRVKAGATIAVINPVPGVVESLGLPKGVAFVNPAEAQLVFLFARTRSELEAKMPKAVAALCEGAALWVFFQKGSKDAGLDMNRDTVTNVKIAGFTVREVTHVFMDVVKTISATA